MSNSRRLVLSRSATLIAAASTGLLMPEIVRAQGAKVRVGLMLPYTGTFAAARRGHRERLQAGASRNRAASSAAARSSTSRSTTSPTRPRRTENANKLIKRDKVDVLVGTVHSGVAMGMAKVAARHRHAADRSQRRRRRRHRRAVRAQHLPHLVLQLAAHATRWARC